jgi:NADPH:quinone reductase
VYLYVLGNLTNPHGGFAEYATVEEMVVASLPKDLSFAQAAALPCAGLTAYQALHRRIPMAEGEWILIHGAAGGVGGFAVQLAHRAGMKIMATCSSSNFDSVTKLGADICIDYLKEDVTARVMEITKGDGAYAILNTVSPESATEDLKRIMYNGHLAVVTGLPDFEQHERFKTAPSFHEISLGACHIWDFERGKRDLAVMAAEFGMLASKKEIDPMLTEVIDMQGIPEALAKIEGRHVRGKIVAVFVPE